MKHRSQALTTICTIFAAGVLFTGCEYPEDEASVPQDDQAQQAAPQQPQTGVYGSSGGNSTLGAAKGAAQGVIASAEQASKNTANEADKLANPDR